MHEVRSYGSKSTLYAQVEETLLFIAGSLILRSKSEKTLVAHSQNQQQNTKIEDNTGGTHENNKFTDGRTGRDV